MWQIERVKQHVLAYSSGEIEYVFLCKLLNDFFRHFHDFSIAKAFYGMVGSKNALILTDKADKYFDI